MRIRSLLLMLALGADSSPARAEEARFALGGQATAITQAAPVFDAPYEGPHSLANDGSAHPSTSFTVTVFLAARLWTGATLVTTPEIAAGSGLGGVQGISAFPNGDIVRVPSLSPTPNLVRLFLRQSIPLGAPGNQESAEAPEDRFSPTGAATLGQRGGDRLDLVLGKISLPDVYDLSGPGGDTRHRFMNWGLVNQGAWDFAADTRGYTWGFTASLTKGRFVAAAGVYAMPESANGASYDHHFRKAHSEVAEVTYRPSERVALRLLGYLNHANMGSYDEAIAKAAGTGSVPEVSSTAREGRAKYGASLNGEMRISEDVSLFGRLGWDDGKTETFAYSEIDRSGSLGLVVEGRAWGRGTDLAGLAVVVSGLSGPHRRYLESGGVGFLIGDGKLSYALEEVAELFYLVRLTRAFQLSLDAQYVVNPAFNSDRGPVTVLGGRLHAHF